MTEQLTLKNRLPQVETVQRRLEELLRGEGFSDGLVHDLSLVTEEVLVNIVTYGYEGEPESRPEGEREILLLVTVTPERRVGLEFSDDAVPFDPLAVEERDPDDDRLGGWGIPMLKTLTDRVEYAREDGRNLLRIERAERDS